MLAQLVAAYLGIEYHFGNLVAFITIAAFVALAFRFRITLPITVAAFFGAKDAWGLNIFLSLLFAAPGILFMVMPVLVGMVFQFPKFLHRNQVPSNVIDERNKGEDEELPAPKNKLAVKIGLLFVAFLAFYIWAGIYIFKSDHDYSHDSFSFSPDVSASGFASEANEFSYSDLSDSSRANGNQGQVQERADTIAAAPVSADAGANPNFVTMSPDEIVTGRRSVSNGAAPAPEPSHKAADFVGMSFEDLWHGKYQPAAPDAADKPTTIQPTQKQLDVAAVGPQANLNPDLNYNDAPVRAAAEKAAQTVPKQ